METSLQVLQLLMNRKTPMVVLMACASTAFAAGGTGGLVWSKISFATSAFCRTEGCRLLGSARSLNEEGGYWTKDYQYQLKGGSKIIVNRYDDPSHPSDRGRILAMSMVFKGNDSESVASKFSTLGLGRTVTAQQLTRCFSKAQMTPPSNGARVSWLTNDRIVGVRCSIKSGGLKELVITIID